MRFLCSRATLILAALTERYASREQYMEEFTAAAEKLVHQRFLLQEDLAAIVARGQREWEEIMGNTESHPH